MQYIEYFIGLCIAALAQLLIYNYIQKRSSNNSQITTALKFVILCMVSWCLGLILQILFINYSDINPIYIDYFVYIPVVFLPVALFFMAIYYASDDKKPFKAWYLALLVIPLITLLVLWTNDFHHLFYTKYSINSTEATFGSYFIVHSIYTYLLFAIDLIIILKNAIKNYKALSLQTFLILLGAIIPIIINILGIFCNLTVYVTPLTFSSTIICWSIAILKYSFLDIAPIALKKIVDQMSDAYLVLNKDYEVHDFNKTFLKSLHAKSEDIYMKNFFDLEISNNLVVGRKNIGNYLEKSKDSDNVLKMEAYLKDKSKYFTIEISRIVDKNRCVGIMLLFKDITQHILDMNALKANQDTMVERERLATLGQMVGGIAHNLKTPIMSISGAMEGLEDLITEYEKSVEDPDVSVDDHHSIANDMREWVKKVNSYDAYMSDIITAVKGQTVNFNEVADEAFTIDELVKRVEILMKHELKHSLINLNVVCHIDRESKLFGNINSLVQVVNNLISNAIQSYDLTKEETNQIDLTIDKKENKIIISVIDHGCGIPEDIQKRLFTKMVTTKGHNGSGLGLFMSYSTIKGHFNGDLNFKSKVGVGTTFNIVLPVKK